MLDNQLYALIIATIDALKGSVGLSDLEVLQGEQPTQQGALTGPAAYLAKIPGDERRGWPERKEVYNPTTGFMDQTHTQEMQTTFQMTVLVTQNPDTPELPTACDAANLLIYILQCDAGMELLRTGGAGIYRIGETRNMPFTNDRVQFQYEPSFDFTLTHKQSIVAQTPIITLDEYQILTV